MSNTISPSPTAATTSTAVMLLGGTDTSWWSLTLIFGSVCSPGCRAVSPGKVTRIPQRPTVTSAPPILTQSIPSSIAKGSLGITTTCRHTETPSKATAIGPSPSVSIGSPLAVTNGRMVFPPPTSPAARPNSPQTADSATPVSTTAGTNLPATQIWITGSPPLCRGSTTDVIIEGETISGPPPEARPARFPTCTLADLQRPHYGPP